MRPATQSPLFANLSGLVLLIMLLTVPVALKAAEKPDSLKSKLTAGVTFSLNSNGIASIPAFSLDKPALIFSPYVAKGRFSYEPVLAYGLNLKPWFIDNWFNFKLINRPKFELKASWNLSSFFTDFKPADSTEFLKAERYFAYALTGTIRFTPSVSLQLAYWNDRGQEEESLKGHFLNAVLEKSQIPVGNHVLLTAALQAFYINYTGESDGFFVTPRLSASVRNVPLSLFFMATQAIQSNIDPFPKFRWNVGIGYSL
jgi:hypothetical protein